MIYGKIATLPAAGSPKSTPQRAWGRRSDLCPREASQGEREWEFWMKTTTRIQNHADHLPHFRALKWERQEGGELQQLPSQTQEESDGLLSSALDKVLKGKL